MDGLFFLHKIEIYIATFNLAQAKTSNGPKRSSITPLNLCKVLQPLPLQEGWKAVIPEYLEMC